MPLLWDPRTVARLVALLIWAGASATATSPARAQTPPAPYQREGATVRLSEHVYVIPDFKVGMVPNVGIVVGTKGALVIDPGMGWRNGEVVLREVQKVSADGNIYIANTHFHPEHTTGEVAFPASAKVVRAAAQQQDVDEMGMTWVGNFAARSPEIAALLKNVTFRKPAQLFELEMTLDLGGRPGPDHAARPRAYPGRHRDVRGGRPRALLGRPDHERACSRPSRHRNRAATRGARAWTRWSASSPGSWWERTTTSATPPTLRLTAGTTGPCGRARPSSRRREVGGRGGQRPRRRIQGEVPGLGAAGAGAGRCDGVTAVYRELP